MRTLVTTDNNLVIHYINDLAIDKGVIGDDLAVMTDKTSNLRHHDNMCQWWFIMICWKNVIGIRALIYKVLGFNSFF